MIAQLDYQSINHLISEANHRNKNKSKTDSEIMLWVQKGYYNNTDNCPDIFYILLWSVQTEYFKKN